MGLGLTYMDFLRFNENGDVQLIFFCGTVALIIIGAFLATFLCRKQKCSSWVICNSLLLGGSVVHVMWAIRLQLMVMWQRMQADTFLTDDAVFSMHAMLLGFGQLTYEISWLATLFVLFQIFYVARSKRKSEYLTQQP